MPCPFSTTVAHVSASSTLNLNLSTLYGTSLILWHFPGWNLFPRTATPRIFLLGNCVLTTTMRRGFSRLFAQEFQGTATTAAYNEKYTKNSNE